MRTRRTLRDRATPMPGGPAPGGPAPGGPAPGGPAPGVRQGMNAGTPCGLAPAGVNREHGHG